MKFKLIVAFVDDRLTGKILDAAREHGATGATIIPTARGEGMQARKGIFGLSVDSRREILLFTVEQYLARRILEKIREAGEFDRKSGAGIALQLDVEDVVGASNQVEMLAGQLGNHI